MAIPSHNSFIIFITAIQHLKEKFYLCQSVDRCDADTSGQATCYGSHKFTILIFSVFCSKGVSTPDV